MSDTWLKGIQKMGLNSERCVKDNKTNIFFMILKPVNQCENSVTDLMNDESGKQYNYIRMKCEDIDRFNQQHV